MFCAAVQDTLHECLQLLPAAPCCAEAERCGDTGAAEAATQMSLVVIGGRAGEGFCGDVSQEEREGRGVAEVEVCGDILQKERDETVVAKVQSQPIQVLPVSQAEARPFGRIPMERGEFGSWRDSMRMHCVLCFEPAEFTLSDDEEWFFGKDLTWLQIAKAIFVQSSTFRNEGWNVNHGRNVHVHPLKRMCDNAMWLHEQAIPRASSMQELRESLTWRGRWV